METVLFQTRDNRPVTDRSIASALETVKAHDAKVLYMHTELSFGMPVPGLSRGELLGCLLAVIRETGVPTLCVPTFTFSFCNGEDYDVQWSASKMGVLNEYIRKLPEAVRSLDEAGEQIRAGISLIVFPEGTRSPDGKLRKARSGIGLTVIKSPAPVVPVAE